MSPRAAARLQQLGLTNVFDYAGGKLDWIDFGHPSEGAERNLGDVCRPGVPTAPPEATVESIRERLAESWTWLAVVDPAGVVLGRLRRSRLGDDPNAAAGDIMDLGPSTYRVSVALAEVVPKMRTGGFERGLVTDPEGHLLGLFTRADAEAALAAT
jgi:CBS domain-containing protein